MRDRHRDDVVATRVTSDGVALTRARGLAGGTVIANLGLAMRAVLLAVVLAGCASWHGGTATSPAQAPIVLRFDGDAGDRLAAVRALERATRRHVELADDAASEALLRDLATRERGALRRYDWRE